MTSALSGPAQKTSQPPGLDAHRGFLAESHRAQFGVLKRFTLTDTDDRDHRARRRRIYRYLAYRLRKLGNLDHPLNHLRSFSNIKLE